MEDEEGYMTIDPARRDFSMQPTPHKMEDSSSSRRCWKITLGVSLTCSLALNVALIILFIVFQMRDGRDGNPPSSCRWIAGNSTGISEGQPYCKDYVSLDPATAHPGLVLSPDLKTVSWGKVDRSLPNNTERFNQRVCVLGREGFLYGKHCWEVELKGNGEWAVGVAKESLSRKGLLDFSTSEGIWAIGEHLGRGNYLAFTSPRHTQLSFDKKPRRIRVSLDHAYHQVQFFNVEANNSIYTFNSPPFSEEKIYPWFRVWEGTQLTIHP